METRVYLCPDIITDNLPYQIQLASSNIIYQICFNLSLWLYAAKYWATSKKLYETIYQLPTSSATEFKIRFVTYAGSLFTVLVPCVCSVSFFIASLYSNLDKAFIVGSIFTELIFVSRFISFILLLIAMCQIKSVVYKEGADATSTKKMAVHVLAFAGFLVSCLPEYVFYTINTYFFKDDKEFLLIRM